MVPAERSLSGVSTPLVEVALESWCTTAASALLVLSACVVNVPVFPRVDTSTTTASVVKPVMFVFTGLVPEFAPTDAVEIGACWAALNRTNAPAWRLSMGLVGEVAVGKLMTTLAVPVGGLSK